MSQTRNEIGQQIIIEGQYEEFYQKGDARGNGKNSYMQGWHKNRRLEIQRVYDRLVEECIQRNLDRRNIPDVGSETNPVLFHPVCPIDLSFFYYRKDGNWYRKSAYQTNSSWLCITYGPALEDLDNEYSRQRSIA